MIVSINKINFSSGANWKPVPSHAEGVAIIKASKSRYYNIVQTAQDLTYLGVFSFLKKPAGKLYSLASAVGNVVSTFGIKNPQVSTKSFIFVHEVKKKLIIICYRDSSLDINTDNVVDLHQGAALITKYASDYSINDFFYVGDLSILDEIYLQNLNKIEETEFKSIAKSSLIGDAQAIKKYKDIFIALFIFATAVSLLGWMFFDEIFKENESVREVTKTGPTPEEIREFKTNLIKSKLTKLYTSPYPADLIETCGVEKNSLFMSHGLWVRTVLNCKPESISFEFKRDAFGILPSLFSKHVLSISDKYKTNFEDKLPVIAKVAMPLDFTSREFKPVALNELTPVDYNGIFDVVVRFSDVGRVTAFNQPVAVAMGIHNLNGVEITFSANEVWKQGKFTLSATNLSNIETANNLFNQDYFFLNSIIKKGNTYEANFDFIAN